MSRCVPWTLINSGFLAQGAVVRTVLGEVSEICLDSRF